jgi:hypothetical protein
MGLPKIAEIADNDVIMEIMIITPKAMYGFNLFGVKIKPVIPNTRTIAANPINRGESIKNSFEK